MSNINLVPLDEIREARESNLIVMRASDVKPEHIRWLWQDRIPLGKPTVFAGDGGIGKTMLLIMIAACVSRGGRWPCGEGEAPCGSVVILSAEDDPADTIVPRLIAADADCDKVHIVSAVRRDDGKGNRSFDLQTDLQSLEAKLAEIGDPLLVIIDPVSSYLGKHTDSHSNSDVRRVLEPIGEMAARLGVTIICNTHFSKASAGNANSRVIGSVAFVNFARAAFIVTVDPEDDNRRLFLPSKTNLGKRREGLAFRIADAALPVEDKEVIWAPYVQWDDTPVRMSADEAVAAMAGGAEARGARDEAKEFLLELLAEGPVPQKEIKIAAEGAGLGYRTVQRAKDSLGIKARREDFDGSHRWIWRLPCKDAKSAPKAATQNIGALGALGALGGENEGKDAKDAKDANFLAGGLAGESGGLDGPDFEADFEERAAIREFDGGMSRVEAEAHTADEVGPIPEFLRRTS